jgi:hypothetical protein
MRWVSPTLEAAAKSPATAPYIELACVDRWGGVDNHRYGRHYTDPTDGHIQAVIAADGSLLRLRHGGPGSARQYSRVPNPTPTAAFGGWQDLGAAGAAEVLAASPGPYVLMASDDGAGSLFYRESPDCGVNWPAWAAAPGHDGSPPLAAAYRDADNFAVFYRAAGSAGLRARKWARSSGWGTAVSHPAGFEQVNYLAAAWALDRYLVFVAGRDAASRPVLGWTTFDFNGGGTWGGFYPLEQADPGSALEFKYPKLTFADTLRLTYLVSFGGVLTLLERCVYPTTGFAAGRWRAPFPLLPQDRAGTPPGGSGIAIAGRSGGRVWACTAGGVWSAPEPAAVTVPFADILSLDYVQDPDGGRLTATLRNDHGAYSGLRPGWQVQVSPGYLTSAGAEKVTVGAPTYWVTAVRPGPGTLTLAAGGYATLLRAVRLPFALQYTAGSASARQILDAIAGLAGFEFGSLAGSDSSTRWYPGLRILPGQSLYPAWQALAAGIREGIRPSGPTVLTVPWEVTDPTALAVGPGGWPLLAGEYADLGADPDWARVFSETAAAQSFAGADPAGEVFFRPGFGYDAGRSAAALADLAGTLVGRGGGSARRDRIIIRPHPGLEVGDVVAVSDPAAGVVGRRGRVMSLRVSYGPDRYEQELVLGGVG